MDLKQAFELVERLTAEVKATRQEHEVIRGALVMIAQALWPPQKKGEDSE